MPMIARIWRGDTLAEKADAYLDVLRQTGLPDYKATPGNRGVFLLRRRSGERCEFLILTLWESREAIAAFAGPDIEQARYYPEDEDFLLTFEEKVEHWELVPDESASR